MRVLIAVASKHGSTREIAGAIAGELRNSFIDVDLKDAEEVRDLAAYDAVVLGSAIYAGSWLPAAKRFAEQYQAELSRRPVWLFSSGPLGMADPQPENDPDKLAVPLGNVRARGHKIFVGTLNPAKLGLAERLISKAVGAPAGDFRDWADIRAWAREVAMEMHSESVAGVR